MSLLARLPQAFEFKNPGVLVDRDLRVVLTSTHLPNHSGIEVPTYCFMLLPVDHTGSAGHIHLRVGHTQNLERYQGHIGYGVDPAWRGRSFAHRATKLILPLAVSHGVNPVWITCDPENTPSRKTCEKLGGLFCGVVDVPPDAPAYRFGARRKCRFRLDL